MRTHNFDAEAIAIRGEEIWLFSKEQRRWQHKALPLSQKLQVFTKLILASHFRMSSLVTGADIDPNTGNLLLASTRLSSSVRENIIWLVPTNDEGVRIGVRGSRLLFLPKTNGRPILWDSLTSNEVILTHENNVKLRLSAGVGKILLWVSCCSRSL